MIKGAGTARAAWLLSDEGTEQMYFKHLSV